MTVEEVIGRIELSRRSAIVVRVLHTVKSQVDIRIYVKSKTYEGYTRKGLRFDYDIAKELSKLLEKAFYVAKDVGYEELKNMEKKASQSLF